jgi:hypothetical protein
VVRREISDTVLLTVTLRPTGSAAKCALAFDMVVLRTARVPAGMVNPAAWRSLDFRRVVDRLDVLPSLTERRRRGAWPQFARAVPGRKW